MAQKADKGNVIFILDKKLYIDSTKEQLHGTTQFGSLEFPRDKHLITANNSKDKIKHSNKKT